MNNLKGQRAYSSVYTIKTLSVEERYFMKELSVFLILIFFMFCMKIILRKETNPDQQNLIPPNNQINVKSLS